VYWLGLLLCVVGILVIVVSIKLARLLLNSNLSDKLRHKASIQRAKAGGKALTLRPKTSIRREFRTQSIRSGYAFAHEEGFGELITSGRYIRRGDNAQVTNQEPNAAAVNA